MCIWNLLSREENLNSLISDEESYRSIICMDTSELEYFFYLSWWMIFETTSIQAFIICSTTFGSNKEIFLQDFFFKLWSIYFRISRKSWRNVSSAGSNLLRHINLLTISEGFSKFDHNRSLSCLLPFCRSFIFPLISFR